MTRAAIIGLVASASIALGAGLATAQTAAPSGPPPAAAPAPPAAQSQLPPVEVIQKAPTPAKQKQKQAAPKKAAPPPPETLAQTPATEAVPANTSVTTREGVRMSPLAGSEIPIDKVPAGISVVTSSDIERSGAQSITQAIEQRVPSGGITAALGNSLSNDLQYRGFTASPLNGTPQGLAIYQNGVRINEVFGDAVYFDQIPQIAIADIIIMSNNPVYGLNALGGAANVIMKDGFTYQGFEVDTRIGEYGFKSVSVQGGAQYGSNIAGYVAGEFIDDNGWRDLSPAEAKRFYADIGARGTGSEFHLSYTTTDSFLGVVGPTPLDLVEDRRENVFTSPQSFDNQMHMVNLNGSVAVTDTLKIGGLAYYRRFRQRRPDGNVSEAVECDPTEVAPDPVTGRNFLCLEETDDQLFGSNGETPLFDPSVIYGGNDSVSVDSYSTGGALQAVSKAHLFNRPNQFLIGASIDYGEANSKSSSELGILDPNTLVITGVGVIIDQRNNPNLDDDDIEVTPVDLDVRTTYYGFYFTDTLDVTSNLALTFGGRYNIAKIKLADNLGDDLNGDHEFKRFNPMVGATYKFAPGLTVYGGYSESNRAPTPAELACADPARPCLLENFLVSDPPLKQVVGRTVEAGLRGEIDAGYAGRDTFGGVRSNKIGWSLGYFRTLLEDDILTAASPIQGRGYFLNAGDTLRQGIEALVDYRSDRFMMYASYAFIAATYEDSFELASPDNPFAEICSAEVGDPDAEPACINIRPGDRIPAIPRHRFKVGFDYYVTPQWKVGMDMVAMTSQFFRGDEGNDDGQLPGYAVFNLSTSYRVTENIMLYGIVNNLFDKEYETFGTYFDTEALDGVAIGPSGTELENPRTVTPAPPRILYGGLKVKF